MAAIEAQARILAERFDLRGLALRRTGDAPLAIPLDGPGAGFVFRWGAVVFAGADPAEARDWTSRLAARAVNPLAAAFTETARVETGVDADAVATDGTIRITAPDDPHLVLIAEALARSAALSAQEAAIGRTLDQLEPVVARLRDHGRITTRSRALLRLIGAAIAARAFATARLAPEDKPDILWEHPGLTRFSARLAEEFELAERAATLDRKLTLIGDTVESLLALLEARRSRGLEIAVAALIGIEVVATLYGLLTGGGQAG